MGRVGQFVAVSPLNQEDLKQILLHSKLSLLRHYQAFFQAHHMDLQIESACLRRLIQCAAHGQTGARGLNAQVEQLVEPWLLRFANGELKHETRIELTDESTAT